MFQVVRGYVLRYAGGKVLDNSGKSPRAGVALSSRDTDAAHISLGQQFSTKPDHVIL
jgi:hypothetical protein